jgi:hypothetical protein
MEEEQEYNIQTYELNQEGRDFILTTGLVHDSIRVTCREHIEASGPYYMGEFSLSDLSSIHKYFFLTQTIEEAQLEINKAIERQKCGVIDEGQILNIIIYLIIGTDKSNLTLTLYKQEGPYAKIKPLEDEPQYIGQLNLQNKGNYPKDEQRIVKLEQISSKFKNEQESLHDQLEQLIGETMKLINETYILKEDNAKLNERIKLLSKDNNNRKMEILKLKGEDNALKAENQKLKNDNNRLERLLKNKRETNIKDLEENNRKTQLLHKNDSSSGPIARTTKFEKSQIHTFVPRPTVRPTGQTYNPNENNYGEVNDDKLPFKAFNAKHI